MRIEDGLFTNAYLTTGHPTSGLQTLYGIHDGTRPATAIDVDHGMRKPDGELIAVGESIFDTPSQAGVGLKVYTNAVGGDTGTLVKFKLANHDVIEITVYAGMMLPLVTIGCDTADLLILG